MVLQRSLLRIDKVSLLETFGSAINKRNEKLQHFSKELSLFENFLSKQLPTTDFYFLTKSITLPNKKLLQKSFYTQ